MLKLKVTNVILPTKAQVKSLFYSIEYTNDQLVAKPTHLCAEETLFEEEFSLKLDESEQVVFKLFGILDDNSETDLGTIKY